MGGAGIREANRRLHKDVKIQRCTFKEEGGYPEKGVKASGANVYAGLRRQVRRQMGVRDPSGGVVKQPSVISNPRKTQCKGAKTQRRRGKSAKIFLTGDRGNKGPDQRKQA